MQPVKVALAEGQMTILDGGVRRAQEVVVDGADRLRPGQRCGEQDSLASERRARGKTRQMKINQERR